MCRQGGKMGGHCSDDKEKVTKKRYMELMDIAKEVIAFLEVKRIKGSEACIVKRIASDIWETEK